MGAAQPAMDAAEALLSAFPGGEAGAWAREARAAAAERFRGMGAPVRRDEYWRYTDPRDLTAVPGPAAAAGPAEPSFAAEIDRVTLVFVDGAFRADLSDPLALDGTEIVDLGTAMASDIHWASELYGTLEGAAHANVVRPLAALNSAVATSGLAIRVTGEAAKPLAIEYRSEGAADAVVHHVILVEAGASFTLVESGTPAARANVVMEVDVAKGGAFHHVRTQGSDHDRRTFTAGLRAGCGRRHVQGLHARHERQAHPERDDHRHPR